MSTLAICLNMLNIGFKAGINVRVKKSRLVIKILKILFRLGYINGFSIIGGVVIIFSKYMSNNRVRIISKPGRRFYIKKGTLPKLLNGEIILSTSKGILTATYASFNNVGGEVLCYIK